MQDHLMVTLTTVWNAKVPLEQTEVALHVFGVQEGQCPPGTFRLAGTSVEGFNLHDVSAAPCPCGVLQAVLHQVHL